MAVLSGVTANRRQARRGRCTAAVVATALALLAAGSSFVVGVPRAPQTGRTTALRVEGETALVPATKVSENPRLALLQPLKLAGLGMSLLKPLFFLEAKIQALIYDQDEIRAKIEADVNSAPVVVYTYSLSPFCTETVALLNELGVDYKEITLAPEWFLMLGEGAAKRAELGEMYGRTSMPHVFIGGESIGGLAEGTPGLLPLYESGELDAKLKVAGGLPGGEPEEEGFNIFSFFSR